VCRSRRPTLLMLRKVPARVLALHLAVLATALCSDAEGPAGSEGPAQPAPGDAGVQGGGGGSGSNPQEREVEVGSREWWRRAKEEASRKAGRRVWAWELDAPPGMLWCVSPHAFLRVPVRVLACGNAQDKCAFPRRMRGRDRRVCCRSPPHPESANLIECRTPLLHE